MSDLKSKIIRKMQEGGSITYRGMFNMARPGLIYAPQNNPNSLMPGTRSSLSGSSKKSKGSSSDSDKSGDIYLSSEKLKATRTKQMQEDLATIDSDTTLQPGEKEIMVAQVVEAAKEDILNIEIHGKQFKESLDKLNEGDKLGLIGDDYLIIPGPAGTDPALLVESIDDNGSSTGHYQFLPLSRVMKEQNPYIRPLTNNDAFTQGKNNPDFLSFLTRTGKGDLAALINTNVSYEQANEDARKFLERKNITTSADNSKFYMQGKEYESPSTAMVDSAEPLPITKDYLITAPAAIQAKLRLDAIRKGYEFIPYLNRYLVDNSDIRVKDEKGQGIDKIAGYNSAIEVLTNGPTQLDLYPSTSTLPDPGVSSDEFEQIRNSNINIIRPTNRLKNAPQTLFPDRKFEKLEDHTVLAANSPWLQSMSQDHGVRGLKIEMSGARIQDFLKNTLQLPTPQVEAITDKIFVRTDHDVKLMQGKAPNYANGKTDRKLERAETIAQMLIKGASAKVVGGQDMVGLREVWMSDPDFPTVANYKEKYKKTLQQSLDKGTPPETLETNVQKIVKGLQSKYLQKKFNEDILEGDVIKDYLINREGWKDEDKAEDEANTIKEYLKGSYTITPQVGFIADVIIEDEDVLEKLQKLAKEGVLGGHVIDWDDMKDPERLRFDNMLNSKPAGYFSFDAALDLDASKLSLDALSKALGEEFNPNDPKVQAQLDKLKQAYTEVYSLNNIGTYLPEYKPETDER